MEPTIRKSVTLPSEECIILIADNVINWSKYELTKAEISHIQDEIKKDQNIISVNQYKRWVFVYVIEKKPEQYQTNEAARRAGDQLQRILNKYRIKDATIVDTFNHGQETLSLAEGMLLGNYQFLRYCTKKDKKEVNSLREIKINSKSVSGEDVSRLQIVCEAVTKARDLINEPVITLTAVALAKELQKLGSAAGFKVEIFNKSRIEALKMGGLLAVNKGSIDPPSFTVMEWKPKNARNKKPFVLIGKGIVFDTGGLSLKPTANSMDSMKCDMSGAAAAGCTMYAIAKSNLPIHVIALVPATDNRPGGNAYVPGDIITMHNGSTVEVLNTDAEGRLVLGDALSYARQYKPELAIDLATLTGAAATAIGPFGIVCMGTANEKAMQNLKASGNNVYERLAEFPFWDEYGDLLHSDIADMKNIGGPVAGAITAGKFLQHFVNYPWIHLDIAGPAFLNKRDSYRGKGGTGVGIRLLFDFLSEVAK